MPKRPPNIAILDEAGALLANRGDTGGAAVRLADLPPYLPKAFIAIEDRHFYSHFGIDPIGILRALFHNLAGGGSVQGGSTLTQQLAKNLFLTQERTVSRKIQEAILALWLEHKYSKNQILELYLNRVYFGSGAYGVEAAAQKYFGHAARNVTLSEAAVLAGLMKAPTRLRPITIRPAPPSARRKSSRPCGRKALSPMRWRRSPWPIPRKPSATKTRKLVNYAADYVMDTLDDTIGAIDEDITVSTTLDGGLQALAEAALTDALDRKGTALGVGQGALVALAPDGAIKALVGGRELRREPVQSRGFGEAAAGLGLQAFRLSGRARRRPHPGHGARRRADQCEGLAAGKLLAPIFRPRHADQSAVAVPQHRRGAAWPRSRSQGGRSRSRIGSASPPSLSANPSIALGTSEVTPLEIVTAYAAFANGGIGVQPQIIAR